MSWRGLTNTKDRIFGALVYLMPLFYLYFQSPFAKDLLNQFVFLEYLKIVLIPIDFVYQFMSTFLGQFTGLIIFFILFAAVVRNPQISHFIRFNTMQSILIDIILSLLALIFSFINNFSPTLIMDTLSNTIFLGIMGTSIYGLIQSAMGKYAEMPVISPAAYSQVP